MCEYAGMSVTSLPGRRPSPDDLLVLLAVARAGRYTAAADELGLNHTTIARRIGALEDALGGRVLARGAAGWVLTPLGEHAIAAAEGVERALGDLAPDPPRLSGVVRLGDRRIQRVHRLAGDRRGAARAPRRLARDRRGDRRAAQQRVGVDLEVVVGRPHVHRAEAIHLGDYALGLYASREFLARRGTPAHASRARGAPARVLHRVDAAGRRARRGATLDARHGRCRVEHERVRARRRDPRRCGVRAAARVPRRPAWRPRAPVPDEIDERLPY